MTAWAVQSNSIIKQSESQLYGPSLESFTTDGKGEFTCGHTAVGTWPLLFSYVRRCFIKNSGKQQAPLGICRLSYVRACMCMRVQRIHTHAYILARTCRYKYIHTRVCIPTCVYAQTVGCVGICACVMWVCERATAAVACVCLSTPAWAKQAVKLFVAPVCRVRSSLSILILTFKRKQQKQHENK